MFRKIPSQEFLNSFTPEVCAGFVDALMQAYSDAVEGHRPECGSNPLTFGVNVYSFACKRLGGLADSEDETSVMIQSKNPSFRIRVGTAEIGCHKVGNNAEQDIWSSFPGNRGGIRTLVEEQQSFAFIKPEEVQGRKFVLAHMGNPEDGLCAVFVCQAKRLDQHGQVAEWEFVHEIWKRDKRDMAKKTRTESQLPVEKIAEPVLKRKSWRKLEAAHG